MRDSVTVHERDVAAFALDGAAALRGLFVDGVESLARGTARNGADPAPYRREDTEPGKPGHFFGDHCNWQRIDDDRAFSLVWPRAA